MADTIFGESDQARWSHQLWAPSFWSPLAIPAPLSPARGNLAGFSGHICRTAEKHKHNKTLLAHACTYTWLHIYFFFLSKSSKALDDILDECLNPFSLTSSPLGAVSLVSISLRLFAPSGEGMVSLVERAYAFGNSLLHPFLTVCFCLSSFLCLNHAKLLGRKGFICPNTGL